MKFLTKEGVGGKKRDAQPVSEDDEIIMWEKVFDDNNAMTLQFTVFFIIASCLVSEDLMSIVIWKLVSSNSALIPLEDS